MRLALYQPDIPQNAGNILRLAACFGVGVDVIEPCGFHLDDRHLRRAGMDYLEMAEITRHAGWADFAAQTDGRLIALSTGGDTPFTDFAFRAEDILLLGAKAPVFRRMCWARRRPAFAFRSGPARVRSMWPARRPSRWPRRCARPAGFPDPKKS